MQLVNGAQRLNTTTLFILTGLSPACCSNVIVPLTSVYESL